MHSSNTSSDELRRVYGSLSMGPDEWLSREAGTPWDAVINGLVGQGREALDGLAADMQHQIREHGATFDPQFQQSRTLDVIPWQIEKKEWARLEVGLLQRRRILSWVLDDLYGDQSLLHDGTIPPELIHRNARYLLPCHQLVPDGDDWLMLLGCDIGRGGNGKFTVFNDSTQMPDGLGYVLENRLATNKVMPELAQRFEKRQLASFFRKLQQSLVPQTPYSSEPLIALLTHSDKDSAYFEHAFLANYLDFSLVHGRDLMFRDGRLWLKTLSGLQPLDALVRYGPDDGSDPLELRADATGTPGLLQSIRQGSLLCCNPPGAGLLESGALLPFMEALSRRILGESLKLPSVEAFWLGDPAQREHVVTRLADMAVRDLSGPGDWLNGRDDPAGLATQISADPCRFVARRLLPLSAVPVWQDGALKPRPVTLRTFALRHTDGDLVMPGGLARCDDQPVALQMGLTSQFMAKDVWIAGADNQTTSLLHSALGTVRLSRKAGLLPSRVADHLYWMGRYSERLNLACRALRAALPLLSVHDNEGVSAALTPLVGFACKINGGVFMPATSGNSLSSQLSNLFARDRDDGLLAVLQALLMNAQSVREYFSEDTWHVLERLQNALNEFPSHGSTSRMNRALDEIILLQSAIYGLTNETMSRTRALRFMDIGKHLERAQQTTSLLTNVFVTPSRPTADLMEATLRMADTLMTYRRRYRTELNPLAIVDLLLLDEGTPRSVGYQCQRLRRQVYKLPQRESASPRLNAEQRLVVELVAMLQLVDVDTLVDDAGLASAQLGEILGRIHSMLNQLSGAITLAYFQHSDVPRVI